MGERGRNRDIVERMTREVKAHYDRLPGRRMTGAQAHSMVAAIARQRDRERAAGEHVNKKKGVESGKRRARAEAEARGAAKDRARTVRNMKTRTFVDLGKKGR